MLQSVCIIYKKHIKVKYKSNDLPTDDHFNQIYP